jgi:hypothetical protein
VGHIRIPWVIMRSTVWPFVSPQPIHLSVASVCALMRGFVCFRVLSCLLFLQPLGPACGGPHDALNHYTRKSSHLSHTSLTSALGCAFLSSMMPCCFTAGVLVVTELTTEAARRRAARAMRAATPRLADPQDPRWPQRLQQLIIPRVRRHLGTRWGRGDR